MKTQCLFLAAGMFLFSAVSAFAQNEVQMTVSPQVVDMDVFYNGTTLTVTGGAPEDTDVVLRLIGPRCDLHMKEKGKLFGMMWMNLASLTVRGVPNVCLVSSTLDLDGHRSQTEPEGSAIETLGLSGIKETARIESNGLGQAVAFREFLKLKKNEGLYREIVGNISYGRTSNGSKSFRGEIPVPARLSPGTYVVELTAIRNGKIAARAEQSITVNLVGIPALLSRLAFGHAALYGILATVIAIAAGLAIGMVFQSKGSH
jgi:uncharacterized protein (TIGR02186 family)